MINGIGNLIYSYEERICQINKNKKKDLQRLPDVEYEKFHEVVRDIEKSDIEIKMLREFIFNIRVLKGDVRRINELINLYAKNCTAICEHRRNKERELQKMMDLHSNVYHTVKQESPEGVAKYIEDCLLKERLIDDFIDQIAAYRGD